MSMEKIEALAKTFAAARDALENEARALRTELEAAKRRRLPAIRRKIGMVDDCAAELTTAIEADRPLFAKPRTRILHGIRVGLKKRKGRVVVDNPEAVVKLIRKHLPDQFESLVKVTETPLKEALARLPAADLKRIGVTVEDATDEAFLKPADDEIDKFIAALLDDGGDAEETLRRAGAA